VTLGPFELEEQTGSTAFFHPGDWKNGVRQDILAEVTG